MHESRLHSELVESAVRRLSAIPKLALLSAPTPIEEMSRLRDALGGGPRLFVKRDDAIPFGFGGNKVRKLEFVGAEALAAGADTLVTVGGVQSNHARATAAVAAKLGLHCSLIINGRAPERPTANALLDALLGAEIEYIPSRGSERRRRRPRWTACDRQDARRISFPSAPRIRSARSASSARLESCWSRCRRRM